MKDRSRLINTLLALCAAMAALWTVSTSKLHAEEPLDGQALARQCSTCHGKDGIASDPMASNLAGQPAAYLEKAMKDYRSGARQDPRMSIIAQGLEDSEIKALANWYASFKVEVSRPE